MPVRLERQCLTRLQTYARSDSTVQHRQVAFNLVPLELTVSKLVGFQYPMDAGFAIQGFFVPIMELLNLRKSFVLQEAIAPPALGLPHHALVVHLARILDSPLLGYACLAVAGSTAQLVRQLRPYVLLTTTVQNLHRSRTNALLGLTAKAAVSTLLCNVLTALLAIIVQADRVQFLAQLALIIPAMEDFPPIAAILAQRDLLAQF